jgi:hypothetical protein
VAVEVDRSQWTWPIFRREVVMDWKREVGKGGGQAFFQILA